MKSHQSLYYGHRYPREIISHAVWVYYRFTLSLRDVEDLLAKRGIAVSYETIRRWCKKFGAEYARKLRKQQGRLGDTWFLNEVFVTIQVATAGSTLPFGAWCRSESFQTQPAQTKSGSSPDAPGKLLCDLGSDHGRLTDRRDLGINSTVE